jgi:hypothetical protein
MMQQIDSSQQIVLVLVLVLVLESGFARCSRVGVGLFV